MNTKHTRKFELLLLFFLANVAALSHFLYVQSPVINQIFAHYTYIPTEITKDGVVDQVECSFEGVCLTEYSKYQLSQNDGNYCNYYYPNQKFYVKDQIYTLKFSTYVFDKPCVSGKTAFYFPLYPKWSVADNRLPDKIFMEYFLRHSFVLILLVFISLAFVKSYSSNASESLLSKLKKGLEDSSAIIFCLIGITIVATAVILYRLFLYYTVDVVPENFVDNILELAAAISTCAIILFFYKSKYVLRFLLAVLAITIQQIVLLNIAVYSTYAFMVSALFLYFHGLITSYKNQSG